MENKRASWSWRRVSHLGELAVGDIVRHRGKTDTYVVTEHDGRRVTAVRSADLTNATEWEILDRGAENNS